MVVRYFGGVKFGVSGLINAYKTTAQMALESSNIVTEIISKHIVVAFDYANINKVMRIIKEKKLKVIHQKLELDCEITISVRLSEVPSILETFECLYEIKIKVLND